MKTTIYLDTSVLNFLFADDAPELKSITVDFFENFIQTGIYDACVSDFVVQEINKTSDQVKRQNLLNVLVEYPIDLMQVPDLYEINALADLYVSEKVIPENKRFDALHIAVSVIQKVDFLVSWNFKHLANVGRERKVLDVNHRHNYLYPIRIISPMDLIDYGI